MTTDFSLMDIMGNYTGMGPAVPDESTGMMSTATTSAVVTPQVIEKKIAFVNPKLALKTEPVAPVADQAAYNANIAQQESGGNANIGYHNKNLSSAYGPYGITTAAYTDARKVNPSLPADITQASPEQQSQAQTAFTQQNARYLQNYGVPVNENTLAAAHLLGAKGLKDYQDSGYLSPAAIKANGGEANLRNIVEARLGGQAAPASGAAQLNTTGLNAPKLETGNGPTQIPSGVSPKQDAEQQRLAQQTTGEYTGPGIGEGAYQPYTGGGLKTPGGQTQAQLQQEQGYHSILNSNSQEQIGKLAFDMNTPKDVQRAALDKLQNTMAIEDGMRRAKEIAAKVESNPTPQAINRAMNDKDTGSYFKVLMYQALGWTSKAKQELNKIDPEVTYTPITLQDGTSYNVKTNKDTGETIAAWDSQGQKITDPAVLGSIAANGISGFKLESTRQDLTTGHTISVLKNDKTGQVRYRDDTTGQVLPTAPQHLGNVGTKSPEALTHDKATASANAAMKPMIDANTRAIAAGGAPRFTEEQIQSVGNQAYSRINPSGSFGGAYVPGQAKPTVANVPAAGEIPPVPTPSGAGATTSTTPTKPATGPAAPKTYAQQVLDGDAPPPSGQSGQRAAVMEQVQKLAAEQGKTYDPTLYNVRKKTEEAFATGPEAKVVRSMNVAIDHLDTLNEAGKALKNGQIPLFNDIANKFAKNTGQPAPGNFDALKSIVGSEVAKAVAGGATALGDREEIRKEINNTKSPEQLAGVIDKYQRLLAGQMGGLKTQYESGGGQRWDTKINPRTNEVMNKINKGSEGTPIAVPGPYTDADKERRYQEYLKKRNAGK